MDRDLRWFEMPIGVQISKVGSEVHRALRWKNRGDSEKTANFCNKAIEFWEIIRRDPKNRHRTAEIDAAIDELRDFFLGENLYGTSDEVLIRYYDAFLPIG